MRITPHTPKLRAENRGTFYGRPSSKKAGLCICLAIAACVLDYQVADRSPGNQARAGGASGVPAIAVSASRPAVGEDPRAGLMRHLLRFDFGMTNDDWALHFKTVRDQRGFDVGVRDRRVAAVADLIEAARNRDEVRFLAIEYLSSGVFCDAYERAEVYTIVGQERTVLKDIDALGIPFVPWSLWQELDTPLKVLLLKGGHNNGMRRLQHDVDVTIVTYYNGARWNIEAWSAWRHLSQIRAGGLPTEVAELPDDARAMLTIVALLDVRFGVKQDFGLFLANGMFAFRDLEDLADRLRVPRLRRNSTAPAK